MYVCMFILNVRKKYFAYLEQNKEISSKLLAGHIDCRIFLTANTYKYMYCIYIYIHNFMYPMKYDFYTRHSKF